MCNIQKTKRAQFTICNVVLRFKNLLVYYFLLVALLSFAFLPVPTYATSISTTFATTSTDLSPSDCSQVVTTRRTPCTCGIHQDLQSVRILVSSPRGVAGVTASAMHSARLTCSRRGTSDDRRGHAACVRTGGVGKGRVSHRGVLLTEGESEITKKNIRLVAQLQMNGSSNDE